MPLYSPALYVARQRLHVELIGRDDTAQVLQQQIQLAGSAVTLPAYSVSTPHTWYLLDSAGAVRITKAASVSAGVPQVSLSSSDTSALALGEGWRSRWALYESSTKPFEVQVGAVVVARRLYPVITDADLYEEQSDLRRYLPVDPDSNTRQTTWSPQILASFWDIQRTLLNDGRRPWLIVEPPALRDWHLYLTLARIYRGTPGVGGGTVDTQGMAAYYEAKAESARRSIKFEYEEEDQGSQVPRRSARPVVVLLDPGRLPSW